MSGSDFTRTPNLQLYLPIYDMDDGQWGTHINWNTQLLDGLFPGGPANSYLPLTGGTLTGQLTINASSGTPIVLGTAASDPCMIAYTASGAGDTWWAGVWSGNNQFWIRDQTTGVNAMIMDGTGNVAITAGFAVHGATASATKPTVTGAKGGNAALASLLTALAAYGLVTDSTT